MNGFLFRDLVPAVLCLCFVSPDDRATWDCCDCAYYRRSQTWIKRRNLNMTSLQREKVIRIAQFRGNFANRR